MIIDFKSLEAAGYLTMGPDHTKDTPAKWYENATFHCRNCGSLNSEEQKNKHRVCNLESKVRQLEHKVKLLEQFNSLGLLEKFKRLF